MSNTFWNIDEIQQIFDESTESIITKPEITAIGDRLKSEGYKLIRMSNLIGVAGSLARPLSPNATMILNLGDKLYPLVESAIAIISESLESEEEEYDERKVQIALEVLGIVLASEGIQL